MRRYVWPLVALLSFLTAMAMTAVAQNNPTAKTQPAPGPDATVLQAGTQLVVVDVVVEDKNGHPIHGLKPEDFHVSEDKASQAIHTFEEHTALPQSTRPVTMPKLPPGTFTDYTPVPPNGALNVLLLDALNTPMKDQSFVRYELQQYVKHANPGTRIAIFGLSSRLFLLQGFTSSPETLKNVVDHKLIPRGSDLLDDPVGTGADDNVSDAISAMGSDPATAQVAANMTDFEAQRQAFQTNLRLQYTLDAFNSLGHYLAALPGRKNVIWFSGSFPIDILPDATLQDPFSVVQVNEEEFRETTGLLTKAQVAVYPVDARGLMTNPMFSAANSGRSMMSPNAFSSAVAKFGASQAQEHGTMEQMATDTGGKAFYNTNDLADAVAKAIEAGSNYYTLTYVPTNRKQDGGYREIRVAVTAPDAARDLQLSYRHGYYSDDSRHASNEPMTAANNPQRAAAMYAAAAMSRGAPAPQDLLFKVRVLPASTSIEKTVAEGNVLDPHNPLHGPFRRYEIDCVSLANDLTLTPEPDGRRTGGIELIAHLYDPDGKLLNIAGRALRFNLTPENYRKFQDAAINMHLELSAPDRRETYLRIGLHDLDSNRFGVVEIPVLDVSRLAPLAAQTPATAAPVPAAASATQSQNPAPAPMPPR